MSLLALLVLGTIPWSVPVSAPQAGGEPSVLRVHDLRAAVPITPDTLAELSVLPLLTSGEGSFGSDGEGELDVGFLVELVHDTLGSEFEYEGRELIEIDGGLIVRGPEHLQQRVASLLERLSGALWSGTQITIEVVRGVALPEDLAGASRIDLERLDPFLAEAGEQGALERFQLDARPGRASVLDVGQRLTLLTDYDVEVAEGAQIFDPVVREFTLGSRLGLRIAPGPDGLYLALALRRVLPSGAVREETFRCESYVNLGEGHSTSTRRELTFQQQDVVHRSLALTSFLPEGQALVVSTELGDGASELLFIRRTGPGLATHERIPGADGAPDLRVIHQSCVYVPFCGSSLPEDTFMLPDMFPQPSSGWGVRLLLHPYDEDGLPLHDLIQRDLTADQDDVLVVDRWPWILASSVPGSSDEAVAATLQSLMPDPRVVDVQLTLRGEGEGSAPLARLRLPARIGAHSAAVLGLERQLMQDQDVEIAKYSAVEDPIPVASFQGLVVDVEPRLDARGGIVLDLRALAARSAAGVTEVEVEPSSGRMLQQEAVDQLLLKQVLHFSAQELEAPGGPRRVLLGDGGGSLVLEVRVGG